MAAAASRPEPIPVYAEMSSINPVVVLPGALTEGDVDALATAYVGSLNLGSGQFCTNPGLLFLPRSGAGDAFLAAAGEAVGQLVGGTMLTPGIASAYETSAAALRDASDVRIVGQGSAGGDQAPAPQVIEAPTLSGVTDEVFGASGVVVRFDSVDELLPHLESLEGQLTATVHAGDADVEDAGTAAAGAGAQGWADPLQRVADGVEVGHARSTADRSRPPPTPGAPRSAVRDRMVPAPGRVSGRAAAVLPKPSTTTIRGASLGASTGSCAS